MSIEKNAQLIKTRSYYKGPACFDRQVLALQ